MRGSALALALLLAGCAWRSADPEMDAAVRGATRVLETYMQALRNGDCKTAYESLSWRRRKELSLERVEADYKAHRELFHYRANAKIETKRYDGFRVVIKLVNGDGRHEFVALAPEDDAWRIEATGRNYADLMASVQHLGGAPHPEEAKP